MVYTWILEKIPLQYLKFLRIIFLNVQIEKVFLRLRMRTDYLKMKCQQISNMVVYYKALDEAVEMREKFNYYFQY